VEEIEMFDKALAQKEVEVIELKISTLLNPPMLLDYYVETPVDFEFEYGTGHKEGKDSLEAIIIVSLCAAFIPTVLLVAFLAILDEYKLIDLR